MQITFKNNTTTVFKCSFQTLSTAQLTQCFGGEIATIHSWTLIDLAKKAVAIKKFTMYHEIT